MVTSCQSQALPFASFAVWHQPSNQVNQVNQVNRKDTLINDCKNALHIPDVQGSNPSDSNKQASEGRLSTTEAGKLNKIKLQRR